MKGNLRNDTHSLHGPTGISSTPRIVNTLDRATGGTRHRITHLQVSKFLVGQRLDRAGVDYPLLISEALGDGVLSVYCLSGKRVNGFVVYPHVNEGCRNNVVNTYTSTSRQTAPKQCAPHTNEQTTRGSHQKWSQRGQTKHGYTELPGTLECLWRPLALIWRAHSSHLCFKDGHEIRLMYTSLPGTQHRLLCLAVKPQLLRSLLEVTLPVATAHLSIQYH